MLKAALLYQGHYFCDMPVIVSQWRTLVVKFFSIQDHCLGAKWNLKNKIALMILGQ